MASSTALTKRSSDSALMPPPPPPKRIKRPPKVLDEDTYTAALSHIIARDFFPGLLETESQQDYLNALEAGDEEWIDEAEKKVLEVMSTPRDGRGRRGVSMTPRWNVVAGDTPRAWPGDTPNVHATPRRTPSHEKKPSEQIQEKQQVDLNLSLSNFQAKYTSEDNESFNKVLDKQNATRAKKYGWMWNGNKIPSARQIAYAAREQRLLKQSPSTSTPSSVSSSEALILRPSQNLDDRPASISTKPTAYPRNNFMFQSGDDISETHLHLTTVAEAAQARSSAPPKSVSYASTRLETALNDPNTSVDHGDDNDDDGIPIPTSPSLSAIDAAIAGRPRHRADSTVASSNSDISGNETPRVNGYAFVDAEPTATELRGSDQPEQVSSAATSASPKRDRTALLRRMIQAGRNQPPDKPKNDNNDNDGNDADESSAGSYANPFTIHESSKREKLHHRMVGKQLASKRSAASSTLASKTPTATPKFSSAPQLTQSSRMEKKLSTLTPAAQQLYEKVGRTPQRDRPNSSNSDNSFQKNTFEIDFSKAVGREREKEKQKRAWTPAGIAHSSRRKS